MKPHKKTPAPDPVDREAGAAQKGDAPGSVRSDLCQTEGFDGSYSSDDPDRPLWELDTRLERTHDYHREDGTYSLSVLVGRRCDGQKAVLRGRRVQGTNDLLLARQENELFRWPGLENYRKGTGIEPDLLYRLPELIREMASRPDEPIFITEGEKDADTLGDLGLIATTNPNGAGKWRPEFNGPFAGRDVVIMVDNDARGRRHAATVIAALCGVAASVKAVELPGLKSKADVTDWLNG